MVHLVQLITGFSREEDGQDLLEYALLVALIAIVAVASVAAAGVKVGDKLQSGQGADIRPGNALQSENIRCESCPGLQLGDRKANVTHGGDERIVSGDHLARLPITAAAIGVSDR